MDMIELPYFRGTALVKPIALGTMSNGEHSTLRLNGHRDSLFERIRADCPRPFAVLGAARRASLRTLTFFYALVNSLLSLVVQYSRQDIQFRIAPGTCPERKNLAVPIREQTARAGGFRN